MEGQDVISLGWCSLRRSSALTLDLMLAVWSLAKVDLTSSRPTGIMENIGGHLLISPSGYDGEKPISKRSWGARGSHAVAILLYGWSVKVSTYFCISSDSSQSQRLLAFTFVHLRPHPSTLKPPQKPLLAVDDMPGLDLQWLLQDHAARMIYFASAWKA